MLHRLTQQERILALVEGRNSQVSRVQRVNTKTHLK